MINTRNVVFIFLVSLAALSCSTKVYEDEKFNIDSGFLAIFKTISQKDTVQFTNASQTKTKYLFVAGIDSFTLNRKGWFINARPFKRITMHLGESPGDTLVLGGEDEIELVKDPAVSGSGISIHFDNLYFSDSSLPVLRHDTVRLNDKRISGFYVFNTQLIPRHPSDVSALYVSPKEGFLGFKLNSGEIWVNKGM